MKIMVEWNFEKPITNVKKYSIYGMMANFLKNDKQFRNIRPDKKGKCELCNKFFADNEYMTLALNKGKDGNLLICDSCRDEAIENGVSCNYRKAN
jgi:superfamily II helicase